MDASSSDLEFWDDFIVIVYAIIIPYAFFILSVTITHLIFVSQCDWRLEDVYKYPAWERFVWMSQVYFWSRPAMRSQPFLCPLSFENIGVLSCLSSCLDAVKIDKGFHDCNGRVNPSLSTPDCEYVKTEPALPSEAMYISRIHRYMEAIRTHT